jgi:Uma2 family endonuclease
MFTEYAAVETPNEQQGVTRTPARQASAPRTVAEYLAMPEGPPYYQFIHGVVKEMASPSIFHQTISRRLFSRLMTFVERNKLGEVWYAPLDVYLDEKNYLQPDILFVSNERSHIIQKRINGAPDLVVEILSPSNAKDDVVDKKAVYEAFGVREYWLLDPNKESIEVWVNTERGFERTNSVLGGRGSVESSVLQGFSVEAETIFQA